MSNSRKKAVFKDGYGSPSKVVDKRLAAKAVRNFRGYIPDGAWYKRLYNQWDICDYIFDERWADPEGVRAPFVERRRDGNYINK